MKKRFVTTLLSLLACIACAIGLVACGEDSVAGKTYEFEKFTVVSGAEESQKAEIEANCNEYYAGATLSFDTEGNFTLTINSNSATGTYTQKGSDITITVNEKEQKATLSGDTVTLESENEGITGSISFKLAADKKDEGGNKEDGKEDEKPASPIGVKGKTFIFSDVTVSYDETVSEATKTETNAMINDMKTSYASTKFVFDMEGGFTLYGPEGTPETTGTYTQSGANVVCTVGNDPQTFTLNGNNLSVVDTHNGVTMTMVYTPQS